MTSFILRNVEDDLWKRFRERARGEGRTLRWIVLQLIAHYIRHGLPKEKH